VVQALQGLAHRPAAHPELGGEAFLDEVVTGREGAGDEQLLQPSVDVLAQRDGVDVVGAGHLSSPPSRLGVRPKRHTTVNSRQVGM
jgi:hypothetical protein